VSAPRVFLAWAGEDPLDRWLAEASPETRAEALRRRHLPARREHLAGRRLARAALAAVTGAAPARVRFELDPEGRPFAPGGPDFNIAHSRGLIACAVATGPYRVGVDVEAWGRRVRAAALAERFFAPTERALLAPLEGAAHAQAFFSLWTLKEALLKATGEGLRRPLAEVAFTLSPQPQRVDPGAGEGPWSFALCAPTDAHRLALAWAHEPEGQTTQLEWLDLGAPLGAPAPPAPSND